jgi:hypothetical protein
MAGIRQLITDKINDLSKSLNATPVQSQVRQSQQNFKTSETLLYKPQGKTSAGFTQLVSTVSDVVNEAEGSLPDQVQQQVGVAQLDVSAAEKQLKNEVGSAQSDLESITGKTALVADGALDVVIVAPFPEAMAAALKTTTTLTSTNIADIIKDNVNTDNIVHEVDDEIADPVENIVGNLFPNSKSTAAQLDTVVSTIASNNATLLSNSSKGGFNSLIENVVEQSLNPTLKLLGSAAFKNGKPVSIPIGDMQKIIKLRSAGNISGAANILQQYSGKSKAELEALIIKIDNKASTQVNDAVASKHLNIQRTDTFVNLWKEEVTVEKDKVFTPIIGKEITSEVLNMTREVTEIIVMFMESPGASVENYHNNYVNKYGIGFNPHFYIGYDAIAYRGRPLEIEAKSNTNTITNDHYKRSIIIGVNINEKSDIHKLAPGQQVQMLSLIRQILEAKPGMQVYSAKDVGWNYNVDNDALNIPLFVKTKLNKTNIVDYNPKTQPPLTASKLATYYVRPAT